MESNILLQLLLCFPNGRLLIHKIQGILSPALTGFSVHVMALTAINRYICVAQQRLYNKMFSKQGTCVIVLVDAVILVGLTTFPCLAGLAKVTLDPRRALCFTTFQQQTLEQMIGNLFLCLNVLLPLFIICLCYFRVFIAIRKNSFRVEEARLASVRIKEVRMIITKTVFAVLVGFLFCWIPAMVCNYLSFNMVSPRFPRQGESVFTFFLSVSSAINPFIYGTTFRSLTERNFFILFVAENYACETNKGIMNKIIYIVERLVSISSGNLLAYYHKSHEYKTNCASQPRSFFCDR